MKINKGVRVFGQALAIATGFLLGAAAAAVVSFAGVWGLISWLGIETFSIVILVIIAILVLLVFKELYDNIYRNS